MVGFSYQRLCTLQMYAQQISGCSLVRSPVATTTGAHTTTWDPTATGGHQRRIHQRMRGTGE